MGECCVSVDASLLKQGFIDVYGSAPAVIVRAPGRVNVIGEHTDYNHGFVLPMAIERETMIAARPRADRELHAYAANMKEKAVAHLDRCARDPKAPWLDYVVGVAGELKKLDLPVSGADIMISGDVPIGCGLSSSAALEMAALTCFEVLGGFKVEGADAPRLGQRVENEFLGLKTGIMDQFISRMGKAGHVLFLDCRSFVYELVPVAFPDSVFVVANTGVSRGLTASKYNERVQECADAVAALQARTGRPGTHLRDFTMAELEKCVSGIPDNVFRRARHIITENERTVAACEAMRAGDAARLGTLMSASDASLRDDYAVTCPELDTMTAIARGLPGCLGSRMTGAGFGGCTVSLVGRDAADAFCRELAGQYTAATGLSGEVLISCAAEGAGRVDDAT